LGGDICLPDRQERNKKRRLSCKAGIFTPTFRGRGRLHPLLKIKKGPLTKAFLNLAGIANSKFNLSIPKIN
jgi:hypothetical protein